MRDLHAYVALSRLRKETPEIKRPYQSHRVSKPWKTWRYHKRLAHRRHVWIDSRHSTPFTGIAIVHSYLHSIFYYLFWRLCTSTSGSKFCLRPFLYLSETSGKSTSFIRDSMLLGSETRHDVGTVTQNITFCFHP